jgi:hypothetical protein
MGYRVKFRGKLGAFWRVLMVLENAGNARQVLATASGKETVVHEVNNPS